MIARTTTNLEHFRPAEFRGWYGSMSPRLLALLDRLRTRWGHPIMISPADGALGRRLGREDTSQHNLDRWGEVRAADVMPVVRTPQGTRGLTGAELRMFYQLAQQVGFTGVGLYPDWLPYPGAHLDVRTDRQAGAPAKWAGIDTGAGQRYVAIEQAWG